MKVENRTVIEQFLVSRTEEAFCALFEVACLRVRRYFLLRGLDLSTAEDLTQNVLLKVYIQIGDLHTAENFYGWLFTIARNEMISYWRGKQARVETVEIESLSNEQTVGLTIEPLAMPEIRLMEWLKALDPTDRDLVVLRFVEGLTYEELAKVLSLPIGTIKWRIFNTRKKLSNIISPFSENITRQRIN